MLPRYLYKVYKYLEGFIAVEKLTYLTPAAAARVNSHSSNML